MPAPSRVACSSQWVGSLAHLTTLAREQGLAPAAFEPAYRDLDLSEHLTRSQDWLRRLGGQGYPTLGLAQGDRLVPLPLSSFLGEPEAFARRLESLMAA